MTEVKMPKLSMTMEKGLISSWLKKEGDDIKKDEAIALIETDKAIMELTSPVDGVLKKILVEPNTEVVVGATVAIIGYENEDMETKNDEMPFEKEHIKREVENTNTLEEKLQYNDRVIASPVVKKIANRYKIDLKKMNGRGPGGRIVKKDILEYLNKKEKEKEKVEEEENVKVKEVIKFTNMRKAIAKKMTESVRNKPHFSLYIEVKIDNLLKVKNDIKEQANEKITITAFLVKAVCIALKNHPQMNSWIFEDSIKILSEKNIGIATETEKGIIVPVIKNADKLNLIQIASRIRELSSKARSGKIDLEDIKGGTFTISNLGMYGILSCNVIINPPEAAILGVGSKQEKYFKLSSKNKFIPIINISLSADHRAIDGAKASNFLNDIKEYIENPYLLII